MLPCVSLLSQSRKGKKPWHIWKPSKGRQLRLIVLPVATATTERVTDELRLREAGARLFAEADHIEREPGTLSSDPYKAAFGEIIAEKHRKIGLQL